MAEFIRTMETSTHTLYTERWHGKMCCSFVPFCGAYFNLKLIKEKVRAEQRVGKGGRL